MPDCLYPPKGASGPKKLPPLMLIVPVRIRRATAMARSSSALYTAPDRPKIELLAMRAASSSPSWGMTASTGPNASSCAISLSGSTPASRVGG